MTKEVHAAHILCKTEKKALEVKELLASGQESFAQMARKYSQCPSGKSGGDLGWFGKGRMVPEFEKAAFELANPGDLSEPVKTQFGWHIIKLEEKKPAGVAPFEDVREGLEQKVLMEAQKAAYDKKVEELRQKFGVTMK